MKNRIFNRFVLFLVTVFLCVTILCPVLSGESLGVYAGVTASVNNSWDAGATVSISTSDHEASDDVTVTIVFDRGEVSSVSDAWGCKAVSASGNTVVVKLDDWGVTGNPGFNVSGSGLSGVSVSSCSESVVHASTPTPENTNTPVPTTPKATNTPKATDVPKATNTPKPTNTPMPTDTPKATVAPKPTKAAEPTAVAVATATPAPTSAPKPETTTAPKATATPVPTATNAASTTKAPTDAPKPEVVAEPQTNATSPDNDDDISTSSGAVSTQAAPNETAETAPAAASPNTDGNSSEVSASAAEPSDENSTTSETTPAQTTAETTAETATETTENSSASDVIVEGGATDPSDNINGMGTPTPTPTLFEGDKAGGQIAILKQKNSFKWIFPILIVLLFLLLGRIYRLRNDGYTGPELAANIIPIPALTEKILDILAPTRQADLPVQDALSVSEDAKEPKVVNGYLQKERDPYALRPVNYDKENAEVAGSTKPEMKLETKPEVKSMNNSIEPAAVGDAPEDITKVSPFKPLMKEPTENVSETKAIASGVGAVLADIKDEDNSKKSEAAVVEKPRTAVKQTPKPTSKGAPKPAAKTPTTGNKGTKSSSTLPESGSNNTFKPIIGANIPAPWDSPSDSVASPFKPINSAINKVKAAENKPSVEQQYEPFYLRGQDFAKAIKNKPSVKQPAENQPAEKQAFVPSPSEAKPSAEQKNSTQRNNGGDESSFGGFLDRIHKM